jgi:hypothetical protein
LKKTPEERIVLMQPKLLKTIKKVLPQIRSPYAAKELMQVAIMISKELKQIKNPEITK